MILLIASDHVRFAGMRVPATSEATGPGLSDPGSPFGSRALPAADQRHPCPGRSRRSSVRSGRIRDRRDRPGASTIIGAMRGPKAEPDGPHPLYTLPLTVRESALVLELPYDPIRISRRTYACNGPTVLAVSTVFP